MAALRDRGALTAVTGEPAKRAQLERRAAHLLRDGDRVLAGNWLSGELLRDEQFDTVLADYLLGSIDGFAPFFQTELFVRLRPLLRDGGRLYVVGLEPLPLGELSGSERASGGAGAELLLEVARVRDACITLAGRKPYREYPLRWAERQLERAGFRVLRSVRIGARYTRSFIHGQISVARRMLALARARLAASDAGRGSLSSASHVWSLPNRFAALGDGGSSAVQGLAALLETLAQRANSLPASSDFQLGNDYIITATVDRNSSSAEQMAIAASTPLAMNSLVATPPHLMGLDW